MIPRLHWLATFTVASGLLLGGCASTAEVSDPGSTPSEDAVACSQTALITELPLNERLSQMLMGGINADLGESAVRAAIGAIGRDWVGGVNFLGNSSAAYDDNQLAEAVDAGGQMPPFLAVDEEGGRVQRLSEVVGTKPSARVMAQTMTPAQVRRSAKRTGRAMRRLSLNMNLAPVVDVSAQQDWEVIGDRSFSDDPHEVVEYAGAYAEGLRDVGIIPVLKHFPGLGSGTGNTDFESASTAPLEQLKRSDLVPYQTLLSEEPVAVMLTNAAVPGLTGSTPATLSPAAYEVLRGDHGFDGVAMTDSLSAVATTEGIPVGQAIGRALRAGADVALWDSLSEAAAIRSQLRRMVMSGRLPESRVNESVGRILALKDVNLCEGR